MNCCRCGAVMRYDPDSYGIICDYCGYKKEMHRPEEMAVEEEQDFSTAMRGAVTDWGLATRTVICDRCGAVSIYDINQISGICPFCGATALITPEASEQVIAPDSIIPFSVSRDEAVKKFYQWKKWDLLAPEEFRTGKQVLGNLTGVYIPFWTFDADTVSTYDGNFAYVSSGEDYEKVDYRKKKGVIELFIDDYCVCASRRFINDTIISRVASFKASDLVPYTPEALPGFAAEKYTIGIDEAWMLAKNGIPSVITKAACDKEKADSCKNIQMSIEYHNMKYRYVLVPVWLSVSNYMGKTYNVAISGHTGICEGDKPHSPIKVALMYLILVGIPVGFMLLIFLSCLII